MTGEKIAVPFGAWALDSGAWAPNPRMLMSAEEQHASNLFGGYSCIHYMNPKTCPICKGA